MKAETPTPVRGGFRPAFALARALSDMNLRAAFALRGAFWTQAVLMGVNNILFFAIWWLLLMRYDDIAGWKLGDFAAIYAVTAGGFGIWIVFFGGVRELARKIVDGELDVYLTQPKPVLLQVFGARSYPSGWGDMGTAVLFFVTCGYLVGWAPVLGAAVGLVCVALSFAATALIAQSVAFWAGPIDGLARQFTDWMIIFSMYPGSLYQGWLRAVLFTVLPAAYCGFVPVEMVRNPSVETFALAIGGTTGLCVLALVVWRLGLRRYESGNRLVVQA